MKCPRCAQDNLSHAKFCLECGAHLEDLHKGGSSPWSYAELQHALNEALEQRAAMSEILRVISSSPTDLSPVFNTILANACRLCDASLAAIWRYDGDVLIGAAHHNASPELADFIMKTPIRPGSQGPTRKAALERRIIHVADIVNEPGFSPVILQVERARTVLAVPLLREHTLIGVVTMWRRDIDPFTDQQVSLVKTFADQAVIAIENVRLFTELQEKNQALVAAHVQVSEALERQTATSEILRVISSSPTDVQPVLDAVVESAVRLCDAYDARIWRLEGDRIVRAAGSGPLIEDGRTWLPLDAGVPSTQAFLERRTVLTGDVTASGIASVVDVARRLGIRAVLATPLMREGQPIGVLTVRRRESGPFSNKHVELLRIFADQAVIAIENVRLFTELQASNRELTTALEQQTATSEILRVISRSQTELQPVFDTIVDSAARLCHADIAGLFRVEDGQLNEVSSRSRLDPNFQERMRQVFPRPLDDSTHMGRALLERRIIHVADLADPSAPPSAARLQAIGFRAHLAVPMLRGGEPIGGLSMLRRTAGLFSDDQVQLLQTFADQAVIAVENARLLNELQARTEELTRSVEQLTALGEVGRAVSSTLHLETVLTTIVSRAVELSRLDGGVVFEYDEGTEEFVHRVATDVGGALAEARRTTRVRKGEGVVGQTALTLEPAQVADITVPGAYDSRLRENLIASGIRAVLAVPMVREGELIGCLVVSRNGAGEFPAETIELLRTFATQSALAIQNARLFRELAEKSRQLEAASQHKSEFLANMSHELRTPLNAIIGFSEVLAERMFGDLNDKQDEYLRDIHTSGQHLLSLINDILDLSKIEAGKMELELTDFHLPAALDNALTLVRERAGRHGIALHAATDDRLEYIRADERKIKQVLLNLLSNAVKFTPEGGRIDVEAKPVNGGIQVSVSDTGVGIAPEDQEAIFEEFRQVGTAEKKVEGTGLGLALSRRFIELHGGKIWVKSQVGEGSTFTFTLPVRHGE